MLTYHFSWLAHTDGSHCVATAMQVMAIGGCAHKQTSCIFSVSEGGEGWRN